jgi:hypothetical protein
MSERKEYELTQERYDRLLKACQSVPYMVIGGVEPASPQENANRAWEALGLEMGFLGRTVEPSSRGKMFFTAEPATPAKLALITPCPVCGSIDDCPHTPVRCQHEWITEAGNHHNGNAHLQFVPGDLRTCEHCGRVERAQLAWDTVRP